MNRSETKAATTTGASTPSLSRTAMPPRERSVEGSLGAAARDAARSACAAEGDREEARGVDQQRDLRAAGGREQAAEDGTEGETEVAGRLDAPVGRGDTPGARLRAGTSANSAGCATATPTPSSAVRARVAARPPKVSASTAAIAACPRRRRAAAAGPRAGRRAAPPARRGPPRAPTAREQPGDRDPRPRALLHKERERDEAEEVAQRGEAHRAGEQTAIAHAQAPAAACIICAACSIVFVRSCAGENSMRSASSSTTTLWPAGR